MTQNKKISDGLEHKFTPLRSIDLSKIHCFDDLVRQMSHTAFGGRSLGKAADVMCEMFTDPDCFVVATISGAMTIAKQSAIFAELIDCGFIDAVVTTGALVCHGFAEELGKMHFEYDGYWSDEALYGDGYNRVYDTIEPEKNLIVVEDEIMDILSNRKNESALSSVELSRLLGEKLSEKAVNKGLIQSAYKKNVPIFIPAFTDSELALDLAIYNSRTDNPKVKFDPMLDLETYSELVAEAKNLGILTVGGGVPRNWAQQVGPYTEALERLGISEREPVRFKYGVRICPEPAHWGGLSGCTYSEGVSWGKFVSPKDGGRYAEVICDATIALPLLAMAVLERLGIFIKRAEEHNEDSVKKHRLEKSKA